MTRHSSPTCRDGFSMLELVISILIMAILAAVAIPRISNRLDDYQAQAAAERLAADLKFAAEYARTHGTTETITFSTDRDLYSFSSVMNPDNPGQIYEIVLTDAPYSTHLTEVWRVDDSGTRIAPATSISFSGWGFAPSNYAIQVRANEEIRTVRVTAASGTVEVEDGK